MKELQLTLAGLLIAIGALAAGRQIPRLITAKARDKLDASERRTGWMFFHSGVLNMIYGIHQFSHWPRWDRDPLLLAGLCYLGGAAVWLVTPPIRRSWSRRHHALPATPDATPTEPAANSGAGGEYPSRLRQRLTALKAETARLQARRARLETQLEEWNAAFDEFKADWDRHVEAGDALEADIRASEETCTSHQANAEAADRS
jgi:hypothetical protein